MRRTLFILPVLMFLMMFLSVSHAQASGSLYIEKYDVSVDANEDSTFDVSEEISYRATGEFHRIYREITLQDYEAYEKCKNDASLQCGGFSYLVVTGVYDADGNKLPDSAYTVEPVNSSYEDRLRIEWEYAPQGRTFNDELFTWTVEYKVYGGFGYFDDYDLFYWDVFYPDRDYKIEKAFFSIQFPEDIDFTAKDLKVLTKSGSYNYEYEYNEVDYMLSVSAEDLSSFEDFTVLLKFPNNIIKDYAKVVLKLDPEDQDVAIDGISIYNYGNTISGIPPGSHNATFSKSGYETQNINFEVKEGETKELKVSLEMTTSQKLIYIGIVLANVFSCFGGIVIIILVIMSYLRKGRDVGGKKTIVPWFKPPQGISPVLVGSIKDEKVHLVDITSTILNAAVRGFIKIRETGKKKYQLIKLKEFISSGVEESKNPRYETLDKVEVNILNEIFSYGDKTVETDALKNKFYYKISPIKKTIYREMVERGYFDTDPDKVRKKHIGLSILLIVLGAILTIVLPFITIVTCGPSLFVAGIVKLIFSFSMPAKTSKGTEIYEKCRGFRMFLHTAERFRIQNLTPEMFEKFLPYAVVFGVEKQWAKNFKDIYTQPPDWYEGRTAWDTFSTIYLANSLASMNSSFGRVMASTPQSSGGSWSSGGWSGGGWSGGGGFSGGFSGGGGGGGGGGMS